MLVGTYLFATLQHEFVERRVDGSPWRGGEDATLLEANARTPLNPDRLLSPQPTSDALMNAADLLRADRGPLQPHVSQRETTRICRRGELGERSVGLRLCKSLRCAVEGRVIRCVPSCF